jgi:hypothetical protein
VASHDVAVESFLLTERFIELLYFHAFWCCKRIYLPYENILFDII